jgi:eight-cysteine-cluster-containing protein
MRPLLLALLLSGCAGHDPSTTPSTTPAVEVATPATDPAPATLEEVRTPAVAADHALYARVEGSSLQNACTGDAGCYKAGCSSEVCSAQQSVTTTCEVQDWPQGKDALCGCVSGQCVWYRVAGAPVGDPGQTAGNAPGRGQPCPDGACADGLSCVSYYGIAGPSGPKFTSCETPCAKDACPSGLRCVTIADGPGAVCRP